MLNIEEFRRERESPATAYFQFLLKNRTPDSIHAFVEGHNDCSFYANFLFNLASDHQKVHIYKCGNKKGVYETRGKILKGIREGIVLFFVDKDFSDILGENWEAASEIYVTDYYSIENYLISEDMLHRIWIEMFRFTGGDIEFGETYKIKFRTELENFYQFILPIMAWSIYLRRCGKRPNVNNINFSRFFSLKTDLTLERSEEVQLIGEIQLLERVCGETTPQSWHDNAKSITEELSKMIPKNYVRGKLELCFFVKFVNTLKDHLRQHLLLEGGNISMRTLLTEENVIEVLGPRLRIPQSLDKFLRENLPSSPLTA